MSDLSNNSMWLQNSIHLNDENNGKQEEKNNNSNSADSSFTAPLDANTSTTSSRSTATGGGFRRGGNRLPSLALCHDYAGFSTENGTGSGTVTPRGSTSARASVAGAHSQQLFALQEQVTLAKAQSDNFKSEIAQLQERLETESKASQRWKERAEKEKDERVAAEKKLQDARFSDNGEMASLREEVAALDQTLRDERRKAAAAKADAIRQLNEQFDQERENQEKWWKESASESATRIASLEQTVASTNALKRDLEVAQRNEADLRGHVEALRTELDNAQNSFDMELRQQAMSLKDENTRALLKQEDEYLLRITTIEKENGQKISSLREKISELEQVARSVESIRRDLETSQEMLKERDAELSLSRRQSAAQRAQAEAEHEQEMERVAEEHKMQIETLVSEHNEELAKMRTRVAAAATLNERCNRLEKLANEHLSSSKKHEAELEAVHSQLADVQRANIRLEQERDDWIKRCNDAETNAREHEEQIERRIQAERNERENKVKNLQESLDQLNEEHKEMEEEYEANLEAMLARISTMETNFAQQESAWQKERMTLRAAENDARRANLEGTDSIASLQAEISMLNSRLEDANNAVLHSRRERDHAVSQLDDLRGQISEQQRNASKNEVELAAAKSTVRALETRLEVVRAGSVAASVSMAGTQQQQQSSSSSSSFQWNSGFNGFSGLPTTANSSQQSSSSNNNNNNNKAGEVTEIEDNFSSSSQNASSRPTLKSTVISRANSADNNNNIFEKTTSYSKSSALADNTNKQSGTRRGREEDQQQNDCGNNNSTRVLDDDKERVFAFTGFDSAEVQSLQREVESLGGRVVECKANSAPPKDITHLVSNGLMTVKLLVTLSRGCWVVPSSFIHQCVASRGFVDEAANGGVRHESPFFSTFAVALSPGFRNSRHANTAQTVVTEGGATFLPSDSLPSSDDADVDLAQLVDAAIAQSGSNVWPKMTKASGLKQRMLICTSQEAGEVREYLSQSVGGGSKNSNKHNNPNLLDVCTWDSVLKRLYPQEA